GSAALRMAGVFLSVAALAATACSPEGPVDPGDQNALGAARSSATPASCSSPRVDCDGDPSNGCETTFSRQGDTCGAGYKAIIVVDRRLYGILGDRIERYRRAASVRRGFSIAVDASQTFDDWSFREIRAHLVDQRVRYPSLEGVLFIGNIKLP